MKYLTLPFTYYYLFKDSLLVNDKSLKVDLNQDGANNAHKVEVAIS